MRICSQYAGAHESLLHPPLPNMRRLASSLASAASPSLSLPLSSLRSAPLLLRRRRRRTALSPLLAARSFSVASELEEDVEDIATLKKRYFELAKQYHPDMNGEEFQTQFVELGRAYETMLRRLTEEAGGDAGEVEDYDEDAAHETFSRMFESLSDTLSQGLSRQQRRELKEVAETMVSGGARDGGWFEFARMNGEDDGVKDINQGGRGPGAARRRAAQERELAAPLLQLEGSTGGVGDALAVRTSRSPSQKPWKSSAGGGRRRKRR